MLNKWELCGFINFSTKKQPQSIWLFALFNQGSDNTEILSGLFNGNLLWCSEIFKLSKLGGFLSAPLPEDLIELNYGLQKFHTFKAMAGICHSVVLKSFYPLHHVVHLYHSWHLFLVLPERWFLVVALDNCGKRQSNTTVIIN